MVKQVYRWTLKAFHMTTKDINMKLIVFLGLSFLITSYSFASNSQDESEASSWEEPSFKEWAKDAYNYSNFPDPFELYPKSHLEKNNADTPETFAVWWKNTTDLQIRRYSKFDGKLNIVLDIPSTHDAAQDK